MADNNGEASPVEYGWGGTNLHTTVEGEYYPDVVSKRFGLDIPDISNALVVYILESWSKTIRSGIERLHQYNQSSNFLSNSAAVGDYYLVNSMGISYFEVVSFLVLTEPLCYADSTSGDRIVSLFDQDGERSWFKVERAGTPQSKRIETVQRISERFSAGDYIRYLEEYTKFDKALLTDLQRLNSQRRGIVHGLMKITETDWADVTETTEEWGHAIPKLNDELRENLTIHSGLLTMLNS